MMFFVSMGLSLIANTYNENQSKVMFDGTYQAFWFASSVFTVLVGVMLLLIMSYTLHRIRSQRAMTAGTRFARFPRLIVPSLLIPFILLITFGSIWGHWTCILQCWHPPCNQCIAPVARARWFLDNAWWIILFAGVAIQLFPEGFKLANDIVNYFSDPVHQTSNPFHAMTSVFRLRTASAKSFRVQARARLSAIWADLEKTFGPISEVDVVGYSLGSMIAIDALCGEPAVFANSNARIRLITLGSPYKNIFCHYFPHLFFSLTRDRLAGVAECINVFRANDYVGGTISDGDDFVKERCHLPKGHLGYFSDREVIEEFVKMGGA